MTHAPGRGDLGLPQLDPHECPGCGDAVSDPGKVCDECARPVCRECGGVLTADERGPLCYPCGAMDTGMTWRSGHGRGCSCLHCAARR